MIPCEHLKGSEWILCVVIFISAVGCATQSVTLTSDPPGALVRIDDQAFITPCTIRLPSGRHVARFSLGTDPEWEVEEDLYVPGPLTICRASVSKTGSYVLKGTAMPFLLIGAVGAGLLGGAAESGGVAYYEGQDDYAVLAVLAGAAGGFAIGLPLYAAGEYLDDISYVASPDVHVLLSEADHASTGARERRER